MSATFGGLQNPSAGGDNTINQTAPAPPSNLNNLNNIASPSISGIPINSTTSTFSNDGSSDPTTTNISYNLTQAVSDPTLDVVDGKTQINYSKIEVTDEEGNITSANVIDSPSAEYFGQNISYTSYQTSTPYATTVTKTGKNGGADTQYTICNSKVYAQHLFLGASVVAYNASLGWGSESSRCTVELVVDTCSYPVLKDMNGLDVPRPTLDNAYINDLINNTFTKDENGNSLIPGKVYYVPNDGQMVSRYWYDPDPGFYADIGDSSIDIVGTPVYFIYESFEFDGIVKSWEHKQDESGRQRYSVIIESPTSLLNETSMILDDYVGSVVGNTSAVSVYSTTQHQFPSYRNSSSYGSLIANQSIPNLINVYGFLEDQGTNNSSNYNYGASLKNLNGIPNYMIMSAITYLLDRPAVYLNDGRQDMVGAWKIFRYSPYARIVGPHPRRKLDPYNIPDVANSDRHRMGLMHLSAYNLKFNDGSSTTLMPYSIDLNDFFFNGYSVLNPELRTSEKSQTIMAFIQSTADAMGYEFFISMYYAIVGNFCYPRIKVNLITNRITPADNAVNSFIDYLSDNSVNITNSSRGEEYNNTQPTRTMIIGGKQKRLLQIKHAKYALKQNTLRWNPYTQTFLMTNNPQMSSQDFRLPDVTSTRNSNLGYGTNNIIDVMGRVDRNNVAYLHSQDNWGGLAYRMNYETPVSLTPAGVSNTFPSSAGSNICPYFGKDPITGLARTVTYSDDYGCFFVSVNGLEFAKIFGFSINDFVDISETEIRAAMAGIDPFLAYITSVYNTIKPVIDTHKFDLWNKILSNVLPGMPPVFVRGPFKNFNAFTNNTSGNEQTPSAAVSSVISDPVLYQNLVKLQEFIADIGNENYGKKFMVAIPRPKYYIDYNNHFGAVGQLPDGSYYTSLCGTRKAYPAWVPADSAWEEAGTTIDDSLMVGTRAMDAFTDDNGLIKSIIGYNASNRINDTRKFHDALWKALSSGDTYANFYHFNKFQAYRSAGGISYAAFTNNYQEHSLILNDKKTLIVNYPTIGEAFQNRSVQSYKAYCAGQTEDELVWTYAPGSSFGDNLALRLIVSCDGATLNPGSPNELSVLSAVADYLRPWAFGGYNPASNTPANRFDKILSNSPHYRLAPQNPMNGYGPAELSALSFIFANTQGSPNNNYSIAPKAAIPGFIAIPVESQQYVYGPWISSPDMFSDSIFPYASTQGKANRLENLIGGTRVINQEDLVPWNYGGMINLDMAAILLASDNNNYQMKGESGQLSYFGIPLFNLGNELKASAFAFRGPTINNIQTQITNSGPLTTYTFRTYTKKFTLMNKEGADRIKQMANSNMELRKFIKDRYNELKADLYAIASGPSLVSGGMYGASKLRSASPSTVLVGEAFPYVSPIRSTDDYGFWPNNGRDTNNNNKWSVNNIISRTTVSLYNIGEVAQEFENNYASKAFMSLDGVFHPVSFYPVLNGGCTPMKPFYETGCPSCGGSFRVVINGVEMPCQLCSNVVAGQEPQVSTKKLPPFILSNQADSSILADPNALNNLLVNMQARQINYKNLNPIIMPVGELRNDFAQDTDRTAHHIECVGRSQVPPRGDLSIYEDKTEEGEDYIQSQLADSDQNSFFFDQSVGKDSRITQQNYRFLGLRGPLIISGWGFDTAGYPVPNASGEPQTFGVTGDGSVFPHRINNIYDSTTNIWNRGPILGKNQVWNSQEGRWTDPVPEDTFYAGWGLRPDLWPTGPVDLRWDHARKVWTTPQPYSFVSVQLEDDLVLPFPARGFLNAIDKTTPLPGGLRRMVFVRDSTETFGAPRGAKIVCYYDETSGFYEPLTRTPISAVGQIYNGTAQLYAAYAAGYDPVTKTELTADTISVNFANPLGFALNNGVYGFFTFVKTEWVLVSINTGC